DIVVVTGAAGVLADQPRLVRLVDRGLKPFALAYEFAAHIDVTGARAHRETGDQATLDEKVRIVPHDLAILAGAGLGLVRIDDQIARAAVLALLRHERPLQPGRKSRAAAPALAGCLHLVDERVAPPRQDVLGAV